MRTSSFERVTSETSIRVSLRLDGAGDASVDTGVGFFDHMLHAFVRHGCFDADIKASGDVQVDDHHTVEDVGIVLGRAFREAMADKKGIRRFGAAFVPMDEALVMAAVDISGRGQAFYEVDPRVERIGSFDAQLAKEFFIGFAREAGVTLHVRLICGENGHHIVEAAFKACARALREAVEYDARIEGVPSTKGSL
ncbi:MAG: imidazoleglycerol-phosphate dehydratase HisB [Slackia sp.]|nr:imidazoleglycerol-phosphate dehydratase HisB [Slackia sp.]